MPSSNLDYVGIGRVRQLSTVEFHMRDSCCATAATIPGNRTKCVGYDFREYFSIKHDPFERGDHLMLTWELEITHAENKRHIGLAGMPGWNYLDIYHLHRLHNRYVFRLSIEQVRIEETKEISRAI